MYNETERAQEFRRLFEKAVGKTISDDDARHDYLRVLELYRVLLRGPGDAGATIKFESGTAHSAAEPSQSVP